MNIMDFNIVWYVLCWNEMKILPFMIDYWKLIATKVIVYDNNSSDGSVDYLKQYDWIEVRNYDTNNELNDNVYLSIKNNCWKEQRGKSIDWVIVSDLDEILWAKDLNSILKTSLYSEYIVLKPSGYEFVSQTFPEYHENELLHNQIKTCVRLPKWDKAIIFNPNMVDEINYTPGAHKAKPLEIRPVKKIINNVDGLYLFHFKYLSLDYIIQKKHAYVVRMSEINKQKKWGIEYLFDDEETIKQFNDKWNNAKDFSVDTLLE